MLLSCGKSFSTEKELYQYLSEEKNGLTETRDMGGVVFKMKYLPNEYLVYNELKNTLYTEIEVDSLRSLFENSVNFMLTIDFKNVEAGDNALGYGTEDYSQYKERIEKLNFSLDQFLTLETDQRTFVPVLWNLENTYTVGNKRNLLITFGDKEFIDAFSKGTTLDITFNDEIFYTGIAHFVFNKSQMESIPSINFWKFDTAL